MISLILFLSRELQRKQKGVHFFPSPGGEHNMLKMLIYTHTNILKNECSIEKSLLEDLLWTAHVSEASRPWHPTICSFHCHGGTSKMDHFEDVHAFSNSAGTTKPVQFNEVLCVVRRVTHAEP